MCLRLLCKNRERRRRATRARTPSTTPTAMGTVGVLVVNEFGSGIVPVFEGPELADDLELGGESGLVGVTPPLSPPDARTFVPPSMKKRSTISGIESNPSPPWYATTRVCVPADIPDTSNNRRL
jgi:hypothetical protein